MSGLERPVVQARQPSRNLTLYPVILFAFHPVSTSLNSDRYQSNLALWSCLPELAPLPRTTGYGNNLCHLQSRGRVPLFSRSAPGIPLRHMHTVQSRYSSQAVGEMNNLLSFPPCGNGGPQKLSSPSDICRAPQPCP